MRHLLLWWLILLLPTSLWAQESADTAKIERRTLPDVTVLSSRKDYEREVEDPSGNINLQLSKINGLNLISRGNFGREVIYRGQQGKRMQIRIDGMRVMSACTDRMDPITSYLGVGQVQNAQVFSASQGRSSGAGLAGNVNLKLKKLPLNSNEKWNWSAGSQFHSNTLGFTNTAAIGHSRKKWAFQLRGSWNDHNDYRDGNGNIIAHSRYSKHNIALRSVFRLSQRELLKIDGIYDRVNFAGFPALPMDVGNSRGLITGLSYVNFKGLAGFGRYELKAYYNDLFHQMDDSERRDVFMHMDMPGWSRTFGAQFSASDWQKGAHSLRLNLESYTNYRRAEMTMFAPNDVEPDMFMLTWPDSRLAVLGGGLTHRWEQEKWSWQNTARFDWESNKIVDEFGRKMWGGMGYAVDRWRSYVNPQVKSSLSYDWNPRQRLTLSGSYGQRSPSTSELYGFYLFNAQDAVDYLGNPDLRPEYMASAELSFRWQSENWVWNSTVYAMHYYNYIFGELTAIDNMTVRARGVKRYENFGQANFYGAQSKMEYRLLERWTVTGKAEYLRGFIPGRFDLPQIPPLQGMLRLDFQEKQWSSHLALNMANEQNNFNRQLGDRYTPGFTVLNAGFDYQFSWENYHMELGLTARNLLNRQYRQHLNWGGIPNMGRNLIFSAKIGSN